MRSSAIFETDSAGRYLASLCQHFGKKVAATCDDKTGFVRFPFGQCEMAANDNRLALTAIAKSPMQLDQVMQIVSSHLDRFAFRENPHLDWKADSK